MVEVNATELAEEAARQAAKEYGLNPTQFANFCTDRFGYYAPAFVREWAESIKTGRAHIVADTATRDALERAGFTGGQ